MPNTLTVPLIPAQQVQENANGPCLARAIRTNKPADAARRNGKGYVAYRKLFAKALGKVINAYGELRH